MTIPELSFDTVSRAIDERIRPYIHDHGGEIELIDVSDKRITVSFYGACRFCPSAQNTSEDVVKQLLCEYFNDNTLSVVLKTEVSPELINFAKSLLKRNNNKIMDWKKQYQEKVTTASTAVKTIKNGQRVSLSHAAGMPQECIKALVENCQQFENVEIYHMLGLGDNPYAQEGMEKHFRHITNFVGANTRKAVAENRADFLPAFFYEIPILMREKLLDIDVAIVQVSRPDENGYCSFGVSCDYTKPSTDVARLIIAEINEQMPYVGGDNLIHISKIDYIVEVNYPLYEIPLPKIGETEEAIGKNCAQLINDGDTLQLGIGAIPDAVLMFLKEKKDLGIHTEMFSDGVVELVKAGVVNGKAKSLHPGKMVATFLMGTKNLYEFIDHNPDVEMYPVDYVNHPTVVMQNDNLISINSCIEVDLMGQVGSEMMGSTQFSGTGGQVDYVRGASMSKGGKSIIAMPSTAKKGTMSRIVPLLSTGAAVTTLRNDVDYIVTEYGIARLKGKTLRERAKALIAIAHPQFQKELTDEYNKRFK